MDLREIFDKEGLLSRSIDGYEHRIQQLKMAVVVSNTIQEGSTALIEGATGVGKSLAYLIPIIVSGKQAVIATSTKNLQQQLSDKDLPMLQKVLPEQFSWAILKGKNNYFCPQQFEANKKEIKEKIGLAQLKEIQAWADKHKTGDMDYYKGVLSPDVRTMMTCDADIKHERGSWAYKNCRAVKARDKAKEAQIILANHTLVTLDLAVRIKSEGKASIMPRPDVYVIDEAHKFEEMASKAFSETVNRWSINHLFTWNIVKRTIPSYKRNEIISKFVEVSGRYEPQRGNGGYYEQMKVDKFEGFESVIEDIKEVLEAVKTNPDLPQTEIMEVKKDRVIKEGQRLMNRLKGLMTENDKEIKWSEAKVAKRGNLLTIDLNSAPVSVAHLLKKGLFDKYPVICTSATLSTYGSFEFIKQNLGLENPNELILDSPFDFDRNVLAYFSQATENFDKIREMETLLEYSKGRAFILFTSYRDMQEAYENIKTPHPKLIQTYDISRTELLKQFREIDNAVLFGTKSFWEGIDVKGEQLSMVIIHKLPFSVPTDVISKTKQEIIENKFGRGQYWIRYQIPEMVLYTKQGFGRLIRSKSDRGVMALLDGRIFSKNYKKQVLRSIPTNTRTTNINNVKSFFEGKLRID